MGSRPSNSHFKRLSFGGSFPFHDFSPRFHKASSDLVCARTGSSFCGSFGCTARKRFTLKFSPQRLVCFALLPTILVVLFLHSQGVVVHFFVERAAVFTASRVIRIALQLTVRVIPETAGATVDSTQVMFALANRAIWINA